MEIMLGTVTGGRYAIRHLTLSENFQIEEIKLVFHQIYQ